MSDKGLEGLLREWRDYGQIPIPADQVGFSAFFTADVVSHLTGRRGAALELTEGLQPFVERLKVLEKRMDDERTPKRHIRSLANIIHGSEQEGER